MIHRRKGGAAPWTKAYLDSAASAVMDNQAKAPIHLGDENIRAFGSVGMNRAPMQKVASEPWAAISIVEHGPICTGSDDSGSVRSPPHHAYPNVAGWWKAARPLSDSHRGKLPFVSNPNRFASDRAKGSIP